MNTPMISICRSVKARINYTAWNKIYFVDATTFRVVDILKNNQLKKVIVIAIKQLFKSFFLIPRAGR